MNFKNMLIKCYTINDIPIAIETVDSKGNYNFCKINLNYVVLKND